MYIRILFLNVSYRQTLLYECYNKKKTILKTYLYRHHLKLCHFDICSASVKWNTYHCPWLIPMTLPTVPYRNYCLLYQGIIVSTGRKTFAKGPMLETLFRELKWTPVPWHKKCPGFSRMSVTTNFLHFGDLLRDNM